MHAATSVLLERMRAQLWVVPTVAAVLAAISALGIIWLDRSSDAPGAVLNIGEASARAVLSSISAAMISFTALVFTVTMLVLQLASTQLSPRVTRTFLRDRFNQAVLGVFIATFVFSLLVLASVQPHQVPHLGVVASIVLVLVAVLTFVAYIDHMAKAVRASSVIDAIAAETREVIEWSYPDGAPGEPAAPGDAGEGSDRDAPGTVVIWSSKSGYVQSIDGEQIAAVAATLDRPVELTVGTGQFLVRGAPVMHLIGGADETVTAADVRVADAVAAGNERTMAEDPEFGFRQLVDIALRALSPALNDPSTAGQVIDRLHALLRQLQSKEIRSPRTWRAEGGPLVTMPAPAWDDYVELAIVEIVQASSPESRTIAQVRSLLEDLLANATPAQMPVIRRLLARLDEPGGEGRAGGAAPGPAA